MLQHSSVPANDHAVLLSSTTSFPFRCELSLAPLVAFWQQTMRHEHPVEGALAASVQQALQQAPALQEPIPDAATLALVLLEHRELLDTLFSVVFPRASLEEVYAAALWPFHLQSFYATTAFQRALLTADGRVLGRANLDTDSRLEQIRLLYAYALVLQRVYGIDIEFAYPLVYTVTDPETGLSCHFKAHWNMRFVEVHTVGDIPPMTDALRAQILSNLGDTQALMALLPPEHFLLRGFLVLNALEVTDQEVLSSLKRDLIDRESLISTHRFQSLRDKLRSLFRRPELCFNLVARQGEQLFMLHAEAQIAYNCIYADSQHYTLADLTGSLFERVFASGELVLIDDLATYAPRSCVEERILQQGVRNLVVAPPWSIKIRSSAPSNCARPVRARCTP